MVHAGRSNRRLLLLFPPLKNIKISTKNEESRISCVAVYPLLRICVPGATCTSCAFRLAHLLFFSCLAFFLSCVQLLVWCCFISFFLLRYLTLGSNTNNRYRDTSVLLTEQINVQLRILQNSTNRQASEKVLNFDC